MIGTALTRLHSACVGLIGVLATLTVAQQATSQTVEFTAAGDLRMRAQSTAVLQTIATRAPQFHLALGDLSYGRNGEEPEYCDYVKSHVGDIPFELISGNHESSGTDGNIDEFVKCLPNRIGAVGTYGRQWYVDLPAEKPLVRMILASPGLRGTDGVKQTYAADTPEYAWLAQTIDQARAAGVPWVVVGVHYPCFSVGVYGCVMGRDTMDLLVQKRVDLVLMGHEHNYTRTHQLGYGPGCESREQLKPGTTATACVQDADTDMDQGRGTVFAIVGTGGTTLRDITPADAEWPYFAAASGANMSPTWGVLDITISNAQLRAAFLPAIGDFADTFTITAPTTPVDPDDAGGSPDPNPPGGDGGPIDPDPADGGGTPPSPDGGESPDPVGSTGDLDEDGIADAADACPLRSGDGDRLGCPTHFPGTAAPETIQGSLFDDIVLGFGGNDTLFGLGGDDRLNGGPGNDVLRGGGGLDVLIGGPGADQFGGGAGNDALHARDGVREWVFCGLGRDTAIVDALDITTGCERVLRPS